MQFRQIQIKAASAGSCWSVWIWICIGLSRRRASESSIKQHQTRSHYLSAIEFVWFEIVSSKQTQIQLLKGSLCPPKLMNFWKNSEESPALFLENMLHIFRINLHLAFGIRNATILWTAIYPWAFRSLVGPQTALLFNILLWTHLFCALSERIYFCSPSHLISVGVVQMINFPESQIKPRYISTFPIFQPILDQRYIRGQPSNMHSGHFILQNILKNWMFVSNLHKLVVCCKSSNFQNKKFLRSNFLIRPWFFSHQKV